MDLTFQYCPDRRILEEKVWVLASRLSTLTGRLLALTGKDHQVFLLAKDDCSHTHAEIFELRRELTAHRFAHGC